MTTPLQLACRNLLLVSIACAPVWAQAQAKTPSPTLASLVRDALASHPATQSQRALVASAAAGVDSARWQFYPTPSVSVENATTSGADPLYQGGKPLSCRSDHINAGYVGQANVDQGQLELGMRLRQSGQCTCTVLESLNFPVARHLGKDTRKRLLKNKIVFNQQDF